MPGLDILAWVAESKKKQANKQNLNTNCAKIKYFSA